MAFLSWPYMWEGDFLGKWASVVTIFSPVGIPVAYFLKQSEREGAKKQQENDERDRASRNLYGELSDALNAIKGEKLPADLLTLKTGEKALTFTNRFLNHDIYDSLIFSGKVSFLRWELQQKIQDIFKRIKHHNDYLKLVIEIMAKYEDADIPMDAIKYYELLDNDEEFLIMKIPNMMGKLKKKSLLIIFRIHRAPF